MCNRRESAKFKIIFIGAQLGTSQNVQQNYRNLTPRTDFKMDFSHRISCPALVRQTGCNSWAVHSCPIHVLPFKPRSIFSDQLNHFINFINYVFENLFTNIYRNLMYDYYILA
jgi:hypothetical protein